LMEKNTIFSSGGIRWRVPVHARLLNDKTLKAAVIDLLKMH
jgi:hypothetical protein